jgi:hypothetical protein
MSDGWPTIHIDDWLSQEVSRGEVLEDVRIWLEHFRLPATKKDYKFLNSWKLFCVYEGNKYRCTGCSRMGDVWITSDFKRETGYENRVDMAELSGWEVVKS